LGWAPNPAKTKIPVGPIELPSDNEFTPRNTMSRHHRSTSSSPNLFGHLSPQDADDGTEMIANSDPSSAASQCGALGWGIDPDEMIAAVYGGEDSMIAHRVFSSPQRFFLPLHYESGYRYPVIVWLHNDGFNENQIDQLMPYISLRNYIGVGVRGNRAADSLGHQFDWHDSEAATETAHQQIMTALDQAAEQFSVHPDRIILAGYRSGGTMALRIAMRDPSRFAAVVSFGGRMPQGKHVFGDLQFLREQRLNMLWQWAQDNCSYQADSLKEDIHAAMMIQAKVDILQYQGDDEMNTAALAELNQWIMARVVSGVSTTSAASDRWVSSPTGFSCN